MLRNRHRIGAKILRHFLNEVLSLNAQEFQRFVTPPASLQFLNEVLSLNAQEYGGFRVRRVEMVSSMKS